MRSALETLSHRLLLEAGRLSAALKELDAQAAGGFLAQVNSTLELLQSLDPEGSTARDLQVTGAPPSSRSWPAPAWSFVEFSQSPLSGLLPPNANATFVRDVLHHTWGLTS